MTISFTFSVDDIVLAARHEAAIESATLVNAENTYFQYICQTDDGGHDPEGTPDDRVRESHRALHATVWRVDDPLAPIPPLGFGCFLPGTLVRGTFDGASRAVYSGKCVEIRTQKGATLRVTANHPILTSDGLVSARDIKPGHQLLVDAPHIIPISGQDVNKNNAPTSVEQVFSAVSDMGEVASARVRADDFHGDGAFVNGEVDVVGSYALLWRVWDSYQREHQANLALASRHARQLLPCGTLGELAGERWLAPFELYPGCCMSGVRLSLSRVGVHEAPLDRFRLRLSAELDAAGQKHAIDDAPIGDNSLGYRIDGLPLSVPPDDFGAINLGSSKSFRFGLAPHLSPCLYQTEADGLGLNPNFFADFPRACSGEISTDHVVDVEAFDYTGHVYDLRSVHDYVIANGIATSNCRCGMRYCAAPDAPDIVAQLIGALAPTRPTTVPIAFSKWLNANVSGWESIAENATKEKKADRLGAIYLILKAKEISGDLRAIATMIAKAADIL